jgi:hypothetical protein
MKFSELRGPDTPSLIATALVGAIVTLPYVMIATGKTDTDVFKVLVGALISVGLTNVVGFYFGSSASSKTKDETISTMAASGTNTSMPAAVTAAAVAAAPAAATVAAPPAAAVAAPPAAEAAVEHALAERDHPVT